MVLWIGFRVNFLNDIKLDDSPPPPKKKVTNKITKMSNWIFWIIVMFLFRWKIQSYKLQTTRFHWLISTNPWSRIHSNPSLWYYSSGSSQSQPQKIRTTREIPFPPQEIKITPGTISYTLLQTIIHRIICK